MAAAVAGGAAAVAAVVTEETVVTAAAIAETAVTAGKAIGSFSRRREFWPCRFQPLLISPLR
jgi:hypothetical protein